MVANAEQVSRSIYIRKSATREFSECPDVFANPCKCPVVSGFLVVATHVKRALLSTSNFKEDLRGSIHCYIDKLCTNKGEVRIIPLELKRARLLPL